MVSNARLDLPDPDRPVTTTRLSRGTSTEMFFRLWTRAPCTAIVVRGSVRGFRTSARLRPSRPGDRSEAIARSRSMEESELLHVHVAPLRQTRGRRGLADEPPVGQVFARGRHPLDADMAREVRLDLAARPGIAGFAQIVDHGGEDRGRAVGDVRIGRVERRLHALPRFGGV